METNNKKDKEKARLEQRQKSRENLDKFIQQQNEKKYKKTHRTEFLSNKKSVLSQHDERSGQWDTALAEMCRKALAQLPQLRGCQVHSTVMLSEVDRKIFKKLGCGLTCDPVRKK